jgi:hypothetical protein
LLSAVRKSEAEVFDVVDGLIEQVCDVGVEEGVNDASTSPVADDEPEVAEDAELMRHSGAFHSDSRGEVADGGWRVA